MNFPLILTDVVVVADVMLAFGLTAVTIVRDQRQPAPTHFETFGSICRRQSGLPVTVSPPPMSERERCHRRLVAKGVLS